MNSTITVDHLGPGGTEADVEKMIRALRVRGYETEHGLINGTVEPCGIPQAIWNACLAEIGDDCIRPALCPSCGTPMDELDLEREGCCKNCV